MDNLLVILIKRIVYIFFFTLILLFIFSKNLFSNENNFLVKDLEISEEFNLDFSKDKVIEKGFEKAFDELLFKILISKDIEKVQNVNLNEVKQLVENFKIKDEKFKENKYFATFDVVFNKKNTFKFLEDNNLFISIPSYIDVVFFPVFIENEKLNIFNKNPFYSNWTDGFNQNYLIKYILPLEDIEDLFKFIKTTNDLEKYDMSVVSKKYNLENYILCLIYKDKNNLNIYSKTKFKNKKKNSNFIIDNVDLENPEMLKLYIDILKIHYDDIWKKNNEINTSIKLSLDVVLPNNKFEEIERFEKILKKIDLINSFSITRFNLKENIYKLIYHGNPESLIEKISEHNISLFYDEQRWIVKWVKQNSY